MSNNVVEFKKDLNELQSLHKQATRKRVQDVISIELRRMETELQKLEEADRANPQTAPKSNENKTQRVYTVTIRNYSFDESDKFMKLYISLKNVQSLDKDKVTCTFGERNCSFMVTGLDGKNHELTILELAEKIKPDASYHKVKTDMVVVFLAKDDVGRKWECVTAADKKAKLIKQNKMNKNKNDPNGGMMDMMKDMYEDGDDTTKQMLNKTWYESQQKGQMPGMGGAGGMPGMGGMGGGGGMPGMGGAGGMPGMGGMGGAGGMPGMGGMGGDEGGMGGMGGMGDLAGMLGGMGGGKGGAGGMGDLAGMLGGMGGGKGGMGDLAGMLGGMGGGKGGEGGMGDLAGMLGGMGGMAGMEGMAGLKDDKS